MHKWIVPMSGASFAYGLLVALALAKRATHGKSILTAFLPTLLPALVTTVRIALTPDYQPGPLEEPTLAVVLYMTLPAAACVGWLLGVSAPHVLRRLREKGAP